MVDSSYLFAFKVITVYVVGFGLIDWLIERYGLYKIRVTTTKEEVEQIYLADPEVSEIGWENLEPRWRELRHALEVAPREKHRLRKRALMWGVVLWILAFALGMAIIGIVGSDPTPGVEYATLVVMLWPINVPIELAKWLPIEVAALLLVAVFLSIVLRLEGFASP